MPNYQEIIRLSEKKLSQRMISKQLHVSRNTVQRVLNRAKEKGLKAKDLELMSEKEIIDKLGDGSNSQKRQDVLYKMPDYQELSKDLTKSGVTMSLLWEEYRYRCLQNSKVPYQLTQFKRYFRDYIDKHTFTDIVHHKAGEQIEVDWAGTLVHYFDSDTGEQVEAYLFVSCMSFSGYAYAEACANMKENAWINCHIHMWEYFGGVTPIIVPDNLKTGVTSHLKDGEVILNETYQEMAEHYNTVIVPTRVRHPKDKPLVENTVNKLTTYIIAKLRNYKFFSLEEYNQELRVELEAFNHKPFQKKEGSRASMFDEYEKPLLMKLPAYPYELTIHKKAKVQVNSHVSYDKKFYSVPFEYIGYEVDLSISDKTINVYYNQHLLSSHSRLLGRDGQYSTNPQHMPPSSNAYQEWNAERFKKWANKIGPKTYQVVVQLFDHYRVEQQAYNGAKSILKLADTYTSERLEAACALALAHITSPRYKNIKAILSTGQDKRGSADLQTIKTTRQNEKAFIRGRDYYKGGNQ